MTQLATEFRQFGRPCVFRPFHEMNGRWFWWGGQPDKLKNIWRFVFELFRREGVSNVIWCWAASDFTPAPDYYPGDDMVDIIGTDQYFDGARLPDSTRQRLAELAVIGKDKPFFLTEIGPLAREDFWKESAKDFETIPRMRGMMLWMARGWKAWGSEPSRGSFIDETSPREVMAAFQEFLANPKTFTLRPSPAPASRSQRSEGPTQDLLAQLRAAGSGQRFVTRFEIKVDRPASVRGRLELTDQTGHKRMILAEKVIRAAGAWTRIEGSTSVFWKGTLEGARLVFDVARTPERERPDYDLRAVSFQSDADGDRLSDGEERATGTDPNRSDTDADGLPDGWEVAQDLNPLRNDSAADADGDGFTNLQEYWAACDPHSDASYPGKPSNPNAAAEAKALLRWLALLPSRPERRVLVGQHCTLLPEDYDQQVARLAQVTGKSPGLLCLQYEMGFGNPRPVDTALVNRYALDWWRQGGLVLIKWAAFNPWTGRPANDRSPEVDLKQLVTPGSAPHRQFTSWLNDVARGLQELQNAGVVVLWRPMSEMTGGWFWWGRRPQDEYVAVWRMMYDHLTRTRGLNNLLWVYESASSAHDAVPSDYYYPGDAYVDVVGHNLYDNTWDLPFEADALFRDYPKVYAFPQAGPAHGAARGTDGSWDNLIYIRQIRTRYPRCSFFAAWNSFRTNGGKSEARLGIVDNPHAADLLGDPWILTRDRLDWRPKEHP
jgi:mannan endo-1,4-beta-mannosidase